ncbi:MAG: sigma-70 family RNA polymerase sigma factor [Myxococcota bacterium]
MDDHELLRAWRQGDQAAGGVLLERHFAVLYRFFRNKVGSDADDLIQLTMLAAVKGRDGFRGDCSFRAYLFVVARHELYRYLRKTAHGRQEFDPEASSIHDVRPSPSAVAGARAEQTLLLQALRCIPLQLQLALELHYWEELTTAELADALEVPVGTVKSRLRRGRKALEAVLKRRVGTQDETNTEHVLRSLALLRG